jgi:hypothetical protein
MKVALGRVKGVIIIAAILPSQDEAGHLQVTRLTEFCVLLIRGLDSLNFLDLNRSATAGEVGHKSTYAARFIKTGICSASTLAFGAIPNKTGLAEKAPA